MNTKRARVRYRRTAITVPKEVLDTVDRAARTAGESRSAFISRILDVAVRAKRSAQITERLNALFRDEALAEMDRQEAEDLGSASAKWPAERW